MDFCHFCHFYQKVGCHLTKNILWFILISNMKKRSCQIIQFNSKTATEILNPVTDLCDFHFYFLSSISDQLFGAEIAERHLF